MLLNPNNLEFLLQWFEVFGPHKGQQSMNQHRKQTITYKMYDKLQTRTRQIQHIMTPTDPSGVEQYHCDTGLKENYQLKSG